MNVPDPPRVHNSLFSGVFSVEELTPVLCWRAGSGSGQAFAVSRLPLPGRCWAELPLPEPRTFPSRLLRHCLCHRGCVTSVVTLPGCS